MAKEYDIGKAASKCVQCSRQLQTGEEFVATVKEAGDEFQRQDFCITCWSAAGRDESAMLAVWRSRVPQSHEKNKLLVDNEVIVNFFDRLDGAEEPAKINFRFILGLVLMRKKLLVYDRMRKEPDGREVWQMHFRSDQRAVEVTDPHMDDVKIAEVSQQLNQIMEVNL
ncbi:MAG TPA: hypothetical protein VM098_02070 [Phycisphaerae bacterium]|nr:hypothetical protein [Phycisphaerae bacterium]